MTTYSQHNAGSEAERLVAKTDNLFILTVWIHPKTRKPLTTFIWEPSQTWCQNFFFPDEAWLNRNSLR
jgi:hypothetical protein